MSHATAIVTRMDAKIMTMRTVSKAGEVASAIRTMTVVIAPGPASIGLPRGTMPIASRSRASWRSWAVSWVRDRSPCIIEKAIEKSRIPPAIRKAGIEVPKNRKMLFPTNAKMSRVTVAASTAFSITKIAMKVVAAKPARSAMAPRPTEGPVLEGVEHFPRECEIAGVAERGEGRMRPGLVGDNLSLDDLHGPNLHEGPGPERFHRAVHLLPVGGVRPEVATGLQGIRCTAHGFPGIGDVEDYRIHVTFYDAGTSVPNLEFDRTVEVRGSDVSTCLFQEIGSHIVGDDATLRADGVGQREGHCARAGANLHDKITWLQVAVPNEHRCVLRTDDLGLPSQQFHVVPDRGGQHEERSTPHRPPTTDQFSQRVRSDDTDRGDANDLLVKDHKMLGTGRLEKHDPKGFHVTTMSRGL